MLQGYGGMLSYICILNITGPGFQNQATGMKTSVYIICKVSRREYYSG